MQKTRKPQEAGFYFFRSVAGDWDIAQVYQDVDGGNGWCFISVSDSFASSFDGKTDFWGPLATPEETPDALSSTIGASVEQAPLSDRTKDILRQIGENPCWNELD